ncbi:MAG: hypothetical protein QM744_15560 [Mesorhizobium sp.]
MKPGWSKDILDFWFKELTPDDWFTGGTALDERSAPAFCRSMKNWPQMFHQKR